MTGTSSSFLTMKSFLVLCVVLGVVFSADAASVSLPASSTVELLTVTTPITMTEPVTENSTLTTTPTTPFPTTTVTCCFTTSPTTETTTTTPQTTETTTTPQTTETTTPTTPLTETTTPYPTSTTTPCCFETSQLTETTTTPQTTEMTTPYTTTTPAPPTESQMMCPEGWDVFLGRCYYFVNDDMTWPQAQSNCALLGAMLVSVHSAQEMGFLQQLTQKYNNYQGPWLGGFYLQDQWLWIDGSWFYNSSLTNISPENTSPCLMLENEAETNSPCNADLPSICVKNSNVPLSMLCPEGWTGFQGRCYYYNQEEMTWPRADVYCAGLQATLVSVHSPEEYQFLYQQAETVSWLGGFYLEDQWMWLDGSWFYQGFFTEMSQDSSNPCLSILNPDGWTNYDCDQSFTSFCVKNAAV